MISIKSTREESLCITEGTLKALPCSNCGERLSIWDDTTGDSPLGASGKQSSTTFSHEEFLALLTMDETSFGQWEEASRAATSLVFHLFLEDSRCRQFATTDLAAVVVILQDLKQSFKSTLSLEAREINVF